MLCSCQVCANARVMVAVNRAGKVCAAETSGRGGVAPAVLHAALEVSAVGRGATVPAAASHVSFGESGCPTSGCQAD